MTLEGGASFRVLGGSLRLSGLVLDTYEAPIEIKGGELIFESGQITAYGSAAISMNYGALAKFEMQGGRISTHGAPAIEHKLGRCIIRGGRIDSTDSTAIVSERDLILSGDAKISGEGYEVESSAPVTLSYEGVPYHGALTIKYNGTLEVGTLTPVLLHASREATAAIKLYDAGNDRIPLRFYGSHYSTTELNFGGAYLPFTVNFYDHSGLVATEEVFSGERIIAASAVERPGYTFLGWSAELDGSELYDFDIGVFSDLSLYADYCLASPTFTLLGLEFIYDGEEHSLKIEDLDHPLISSVKVQYSWFHNGAPLPHDGAELSLSEVADGGEYYCEILLSYGADSIKVSSERVSVRIEKQTVDIPTLPSAEYNGAPQSPAIITNSVYTVAECIKTAVGVYPVVVTLSDSENYEFSDGTSSAVIDFVIAPRNITLKLSNSHKYLLSPPSEPTCEVISGSILAGDELGIRFVYGESSVGCICENPNYALTVIGGDIVRHPLPSNEQLFFIFAIFLGSVALFLTLFVIISRRREIMHYFRKLSYKLTPVSNYEAKNLGKTVGNAPEGEELSDPVTESAMSVDAEHADKLITDAMAKSLIKDADEAVKTVGKRKCVVNVDTLSAGFSAGDVVDVNRLKAENLIPYDTAYIKILARGVIDKPLRVYANGFSLAAVKMLALTGGEAVRVVTARKKESSRAKKMGESS